MKKTCTEIEQDSLEHDSDAEHKSCVDLDLDQDDDGTPAASMELVMKQLGVPGRYQLIQIIATCVSVTPFAFVMLNFVFIGYEPPATCFIANETEFLTTYFGHLNDNQLEINYESCRITTISSNRSEHEVVSHECHQGYRYYQHKHGSMASEWDLVCGNRGIAEFIQTAVNLGMAFSSAFVTYAADRFGRKYVFMFLISTICLTEFALVFADNVYVAIVLRLFTGFSTGAIYVIHNVISSELVISKYRQIYGQCNCILWSCNLMLLAGVAALFKNNWKYIQLTTALSCIPAFLAAFILNETPLWYFAKGRFEETQQVIVKACKTNDKNVKTVLNSLQQCITQTLMKSPASKSNSSLPGAKYSLLDIIHNRSLRSTTLILCLVWFTNASTYFGLYLTSSTLAGNRFINFFLMSLFEIPSSLFCMFILGYFGRRTVVLGFIALSGVCLMVSTSLIYVNTEQEQSYVSTAFFLAGKFTIGSSYNVLSAYTPEVFPTTIRSTGTGICAAMACVGAMLSPFLNPLFRIAQWAPGAILTGMCVVSFVLFWTIPETRGRQLPTTIGEMAAWETGGTVKTSNDGRKGRLTDR